MNDRLKRAINRDRWGAKVAAWKESGQTQKAFCEQHHLGLAAFRRWCGRFRAEATSPRVTDANVPAFVPVHFQPRTAAPLSLRIDDRLCIEVPPAFDPATLRRLIQVLCAP